MTAGDVRTRILGFLNDSVHGQSGAGWAEVSEDFDLRTDGAIDSLRFIQLIAALEVWGGVTIDLTEIAADQLTKIGVLSRHIAGQLGARTR